MIGPRQLRGVEVEQMSLLRERSSSCQESTLWRDWRARHLGTRRSLGHTGEGKPKLRMPRGILSLTRDLRMCSSCLSFTYGKDKMLMFFQRHVILMKKAFKLGKLQVQAANAGKARIPLAKCTRRVTQAKSSRNLCSVILEIDSSGRHPSFLPPPLLA